MSSQLIQQLESAQLTIAGALASGQSIVSYTFAGRQVTRTDPVKALSEIEDLLVRLRRRNCQGAVPLALIGGRG